MKRKIQILWIILILFSPVLLEAQSCANYSVTRATGITYTSIAGSSPSYFAWRNTASNQDDDNRSFQEPIGFDFWYLGVRYTSFSATLNGTIDFSSSTSDGNNGGTGPYGPNYNNIFSTANKTMLALAPLYDDLWTAAGGTTAVASSIFYQTSGAAPNRVLTIEWKNFDKWNSSAGSINFQVKIYETTGKIEFWYGTMTAGTAAFAYTCGINGNWTSGAATAAVLLTQQTSNTTTFNQTPSNNLSTLPASASKITFTSPLPTATPSNLLFSAITKISMTLNWTDNATNEVGYAIYRSTDNVNFIYAGEAIANATSMNITGLLPSTTYYWQVHAVTEGDLGAALSATQATLPAGIITSLATGNWNSTSTWDCTCIPTLGDNVTIANGHVVTLNTNGVSNMLTIGQGVSGQLIIGNNATARTLTVDSDIVILSGGTLITGATAATHTIVVDNNIINNGTFDLAPTATRVANVTFTNIYDSDQFVSGTGSMTKFNRITVNMSLATNKVEITAANFTAANNFLTLTKGSFKLSTAATVVPYTSNVTLPISTGIWLNHSGATLSTTGGTITLVGSLRMSAGVFNIGNASNNNLTFDGGSLTIEGGAMNIAGRMDKLGITALTNLTMTAGTLTVATVGSTTAGIAPFSINEVGSNFTMSGGTIILRRPGAGNLGYVNTGGTNGTVTGGTVQIGDALTPASQTFQINSSIPIPSLTVSSGVAVTAQIVTNPLTILNNVTINAGTFNSNSLNLTLGGNWTDNGSFTAGTGSITYNGSGPQTIGGSSVAAFNNLTINKISDLITLATNLTVSNTLSLTSGKIAIGNNSLTLGSSGSITGASASNYVVATGSGKLIQQVPAGGSKTFPVGTATAYIPATVALAAGSTSDNISVRVLPSAYSLGETGSIVSYNAVNATWVMTEETAGGSNATITLQWPVALELPGFDRSISRLAQFTAGAWDYGASDLAAAGSNPYTVTRAGFNSFTSFAIAELSTLPVSWHYVSGFHNKGNNHIEWATFNEQNNQYFAVEYSENEVNFSEAGRVAAVDNSTTIEQYSFKHLNINKPLLFYRIKQVDKDDRFSYSKIIKIKSKTETGIQVIIAPNPSDNFVRVFIQSGQASNLSLLITDITGKPIHSSRKELLAGHNKITIDLSGYAPGIYLLTTNDDNGNKSITRVIKK